MPTTIPHTKRQRVTTKAGLQLERSYVFLPASSWEALQRICIASHRSGSQVLESLISIADSGRPVKDNDGRSTTQ